MSGWLGVVSAAHVKRGVNLGIAQVNHGKRGPLARMRAGDALIYYSPTEQRGDGTPLQVFTAAGVFPDDEIWQADEGTFRPYRRRIDYSSMKPVPLAEVREHLELTSTPNWGYQLRLGLLKLSDHDVSALLEAMKA